MSTRSEIVAAVNALDWPNAHEYAISTTAAGTVYPMLDRLEYANGNPWGTAFWTVALLLPTNLTAAETYFAEKVPALKAVLDPFLTITSVRRERLQLEDMAAIPVAHFVGFREIDNPL